MLIGLLYALVAFGLILIYRANRIINFAQAEIGASAALLAVLLIKVHHVPYLVAFVIAMVAAILPVQSSSCSSCAGSCARHGSCCRWRRSASR